MAKMMTAAKARDQVLTNNPPIEPNQYWVCYNKNDEVFRRLRILALHPDYDEFSKSKYWIYQEMPTKFRRIDLHIGICPEFNLRYVFELEINDG